MNPIMSESKICHRPRISTIRKDVVLALAAILMVLLTNSCSTARGFGQDVEKTGDKIQEAASN
jgi:predicted small secreted protein